jgi:hypothetical protein
MTGEEIPINDDEETIKYFIFAVST